MIIYRNKVTILFVFLLFFLIGCPEPIENPPEKPILVAKSAPDALVEQGIDAEIPEREQSIVLMWHPNTESDLAGYKIYRNSDIEDSSFRVIKDISNIGTLNSVDTLFYDEEVKKRNEYYYFIKAYNNAKEKSEPSDTVRYTLGNEPTIFSPDDSVVKSDTLQFIWFDDPFGYLHSNEYVIRVQKQNLDLSWDRTVWIARITNRWYGNSEEQLKVDYFSPYPPYPGSLGHIISCNGDYTLLPEGEYRWKIKAIIEFDNTGDLDVYGSESTWSYFSIINPK